MDPGRLALPVGGMGHGLPSALRVVMVHLHTDHSTMLPDQGGLPSLQHCLLSSLSTSNFELLSEVKVHFLPWGTACFAL